MHFGHAVGTACVLLEHLGVDSGQVVCADSRDARGFIVGHGQCDRCDAVAVVVGLDLDKGGIGRSHQGLHFGHGVGTAHALLEHLGVDGGQVVGCHTGDASDDVVGGRQCGGRTAVAVVVGLDLGQSRDLCGRTGIGQNLNFADLIGVCFARCVDLRVDCSQVVCRDARDPGVFVVFELWYGVAVAQGVVGDVEQGCA